MGLSKDFTGLSELLLGQAQPAQFQSSGQTGYWWGSKISDDGNWTTLSNAIDNEFNEMPRQISANSFAYYNWYSATAESGTYEMVNDNATDSVCPAGWQLPGTIMVNTGGHPNYSSLFDSYFVKISAYSYGTAENVQAAIGSPLMISLPGIYRATGTFGGTKLRGYYWTQSSHWEHNIRAIFMYIAYDESKLTSMNPSLDNSKGSYGLSIRCVQKSE